jgi:hypothetical protein
MTPEEFIRDCTRGCSNELGAVEDRFGKRIISYHEWLTPDQALRAVEIAREGMKKPASAGASASEELEIEIERWYDNEASEGFENVLWKDICECARHFANWQKQQMMKEALDGEICIPNAFSTLEEEGCLIARAKVPVGGRFKFGDKVKLIIVKED